MDAVAITSLISAGMRLFADMQDRAAAGTLTQADIDKMLAVLDHTLDSWQAKVDAHRAGTLVV